MEIVGIEGMSRTQLDDELRQGAKFVYYQFCISIIVMTFTRPSSIHFIPANGSAVRAGLGYSLLTFVLGWWGIPWGPIHTIGSLFKNFNGGIDVTQQVLAHLPA